MCDVLVAPGHHEDAPGALLRIGGHVLSEYELMAPLARELEKTLPASVESALTERPNQDPDAAYAEEIRSYGADLMVELHFNAVKDPAVRGTEMLYGRNDARSKRLARRLFEETTDALGTRKRRLVPKPPGYHVYGEIESTSLVLCEPAFGSNEQDAWTLLSGLPDLMRAYRRALTEQVNNDA